MEESRCQGLKTSLLLLVFTRPPPYLCRKTKRSITLEIGHFSVNAMSVLHKQSVALVPSQPTSVLPSGQIPLYLTPISAGFPSPADSFIEKLLDLNEYCIDNPISTYFVRVKDSTWGDLGVAEGDILIVDRSVKAAYGKIIVAILNGNFTVKRLTKQGNKTFLFPENPNYQPIEITEAHEFEVWGVVLHAIHQF